MKPTSSRKLRATIFTSLCLSMKTAIGLMATIMTKTAIMMAAAMISIWLAMPTAVMTESIEKTMSMMAIWMMIHVKAALALLAGVSFFGLILWGRTDSFISTTAFQIRNRPPAPSTRSRQDRSRLKIDRPVGFSRCER